MAVAPLISSIGGVTAPAPALCYSFRDKRDEENRCASPAKKSS